jgi:type I restriction enzyme R subunit
MGRERLEETREAVKALCETVEPPRDSAAYLRYFCTVESGNAEHLMEAEPKRVALYKLAAAYLRAYASLANEMREAGYSEAELVQIKREVEHYEKVREEVKLASGDYVDMKMFEPAMRHLLDTYIRAEESEKVSAFDDLSLIQLIVERGEIAMDALPKGIRNNRDAMAETIENNVRRLIIDEMAVNPKYYEKMSELLDALIFQRKQEALDYKAYLGRLVELTRQVAKPESQSSYPEGINTAALRALYDNLEEVATSAVRQRRAPYGEEDAASGRRVRALALDRAIRQVKKADWRGNRFKEREVRNAINDVLGNDDALVHRVFEIVKAQREY